MILKPPARRKNRGQKDKFLAKFDSTNRTWLFSGLSDMFSQRFSGMMDKGLLCRDDPKILAFAMDPDVILLDEPTSALDPTMVGEVQAVIRDLAQTGKTMMIVTHEMSFARAICNRVFYMDGGGIYEDGPPAQIFDNPQKELTRRFIRKLKVLEIIIDSRDYDFLGAGSEIDRYCLQNDIPPRTKYRIRLAFEELVQQILLPVLTEPRIQFTVEYAETEQKAELTVLYNGAPFDPADSDNTLSYTMLKNTTSELRHTSMDEDGFTNRFQCVIAE